MRLNFRKVSAIGASVLLTGLTLGSAAAAAYPAPFVQGGAANVAIVYGSGDGVNPLDLVQASNLQGDLQTYMGSAGGTSGASLVGEVAELFTGSTKIYVNDALNAVKTVLTETELPTVLEDGSFSGNVDASFTQTIQIGVNPQVTYAKQPTSSEDPEFGLALSTSTNTMMYNATVTFNKAVAFNHSNSEGQDIELFGQKFTVASATSGTNLVLLKEAEKLSLDSDAPTADVTIADEAYTIELVSASDTAATIRVTDSAGTSDSQEISEAASRKVNGVSIAVITADETNLKLSASIIAGADKMTFTDGSAVTIGEDDTVIDGTSVSFTGGTAAMTKMVVKVAAANSDEDAIKPGSEFADPVFGTFKLDFAGLNIPEDGSAREIIDVKNSGDDKMEVTFTNHQGNEATVQWVMNKTGDLALQRDSEERNITVVEKAALYRNEYVMVGNEDEGFLLRLSQVTNQTSGFSQDAVKFVDVFDSSNSYSATITAEGSGTVTIGGKVYDVTYSGLNSAAEDSRVVRLDYPDTTTAGYVAVYPTMETSKGANLAFYEPSTINLGNYDGSSTSVSRLYFPDGDGYTYLTLAKVAVPGSTNATEYTVTGADGTGSGLNLNTSVADVEFFTIGQFEYELRTYATANMTVLGLRNAANSSNVTSPAIMLFEEKDDNTQYQGLIITPEVSPAGTGESGVGILDVERTWGNDGTWDSISLASDSKMAKEADLWGTIISVDSSDSDQKSASISYPDEQVYAQIYVAEESASITAGETSAAGATSLGQVLVSDSEVSSVATKNLLIIGGSCINSAAAALVGGAHCGASWTDATGVGSGEFLIKGYASSDLTSELALLVAGYEAADTVNAAQYLMNQMPDTALEWKGTSSTSAEQVVAAA